jgi:hypothetical protein
VLGGMVRAGFPIADEIRAHVDKQAAGALKVEPERIVKQQLDGVAVGVKEFRGAMAKSIKHMQAMLR